MNDTRHVTQLLWSPVYGNLSVLSSLTYLEERVCATMATVLRDRDLLQENMPRQMQHNRLVIGVLPVLDELYRTLLWLCRQNLGVSGQLLDSMLAAEEKRLGSMLRELDLALKERGEGDGSDARLERVLSDFIEGGHLFLDEADDNDDGGAWSSWSSWSSWW